MRNPDVIIAALLALTLAACVNLDPQPDDTRYYVLSSEEALMSSPNELAEDGLTVGIEALSLPSYLDTRRMVTRISEQEVKFSEANRWGENLRRGVGAALSDFLRASPGIRAVYVVPWTEPRHRDFDIAIRLERFEGDESGSTRMLAVWNIEDLETGQHVKRGITDRITDGWTPGDYGDLAARLGESVHDLAEELAGVLAELR
jgi:uncharacterized lipoprotein YmbA